MMMLTALIDNDDGVLREDLSVDIIMQKDSMVTFFLELDSGLINVARDSLSVLGIITLMKYIKDCILWQTAWEL